jgi:hypothetical protein
MASVVHVDIIWLPVLCNNIVSELRAYSDQDFVEDARFGNLNWLL